MNPNMYIGLRHLHVLVVILFLLLYLIKLILLLTNKKEQLAKFTKITRIPEMIISLLFLLTGVAMLLHSHVTTMVVIKIVLVMAAIPLAVIGFRRSNKLLAALSVLMIIGAYGLAEMNKVGVDAPAVTLVDGKKLYEQNCQLCHGEDGKLAMHGAKDLTATQLNDEQIRTLLMEGKNAMSSYKELYSTDQINAVMHYIKTLKQ